jgi:hypothetical protein
MASPGAGLRAVIGAGVSEQAVPPAMHGPPSTGAGAAPATPLQEVQPPTRIPQPDFVVDVVAPESVQSGVAELTRLLGERHRRRSFNRRYLPTILELIMLVRRNPERPRGRDWLSVRVLNIGYDSNTGLVTAEYCVDYCEPDPATGQPHPRRKLVSYSAPEQTVLARLQHKIGQLSK